MGSVKSSVFGVGRAIGSVVCLAVLLAGATPSFAKPPAKTSPKKNQSAAEKRTAEEVPAGSIALYVAVSRLPEPDAVYRRYFATNDEGIARQYHDQWRYHESQQPYSMTRSHWGTEHLSIGSLDFYGRAPYEGDVRRNFAEMVLRQRIDSGIRNYFAAPERAAIRRTAAAAKAMTEIRDVNMNVKMSKDGTAGVLSFNYNVLDDTSRLEYSHSKIFAGFYHPKFMTSLTRPDELISRLSLRVSTVIDASLPSAYLAYAVSGTTLEIGLEKQLAPTVRGRFVTTQPRRDNPNSASYQVVVSHWF